jgi:hypothetical protein
LNRLESDDLGQPKEPEKKPKAKAKPKAQAGSILLMILDPAAAV